METQTVSVFKLESKGLWQIRLQYLLFIGYFFIGILLIVQFSGKDVILNDIKQPPLAAFFINFVSELILFLVIMIFQMRSIQNKYTGFTIRLDNTSIKHSTSTLNGLLFYFHEVARISRSVNGDIMLINKNGRSIYIPYQITGRTELEMKLKENFPNMNVGPYKFYQRHYKAIVCIGLLLFTSVFILKNKIVLGFISILLIIYIVAAVKKLLKSYQLTKSVRVRNILVLLIAFSALAIYTIVTKLLK